MTDGTHIPDSTMHWRCQAGRPNMKTAAPARRTIRSPVVLFLVVLTFCILFQLPGSVVP